MIELAGEVIFGEILSTKKNKFTIKDHEGSIHSYPISNKFDGNPDDYLGEEVKLVIIDGKATKIV